MGEFVICHFLKVSFHRNLESLEKGVRQKMFHSTRQKTSPDALLKYQICVRLSFVAFLALPQLSRELFSKIMAGDRA